MGNGTGSHGFRNHVVRQSTLSYCKKARTDVVICGMYIGCTIRDKGEIGDEMEIASRRKGLAERGTTAAGGQVRRLRASLCAKAKR
jgi:hypothetical protein